MPGLRQLILVNLKLYVRDPVAAFFTLAFPPLLVVLFGAIYGNEPMAMLGNRGSMDVSMPAYTALILGTVGFMGIPITVSAYRESGVLRRFHAAGVRAVTYITADVICNLIMTLLGMCGLLVFGWLIYHVRFEGRAIDVIVAVVFGGLAMFSCGYLIASLAQGARTAQVIGMVIFYPMMFLSGAGIPLEVLPAGVRTVSNILPLTYVVKLLRGLWVGEAWSAHLLEVTVLAGVLVVCTAVAARFFRWE
jgi:ABC-2 type transport system permease protein